MEKKSVAGGDFFQTQAALDAQKARRFMEQARGLDRPILIGMMPLKRVKIARFMNANVEGIDVPEEIISRMETDGISGIEIACEFGWNRSRLLQPESYTDPIRD